MQYKNMHMNSYVSVYTSLCIVPHMYCICIFGKYSIHVHSTVYKPGQYSVREDYVNDALEMDHAFLRLTASAEPCMHLSDV